MKDHDSDSFSNGQKSKLDIVGPNHLRIQTVKVNQSAGDAPFSHHFPNQNVENYFGNFGRYQCPNEGQARIAEYLDLAKGNSMGKGGQNHSNPFFDPLYGASKTDPFQNLGPIMSRGTHGMIFGVPGLVVSYIICIVSFTCFNILL